MHPYLKKLIQSLDISPSGDPKLEPLLDQVSAYLSHLESLSRPADVLNELSSADTGLRRVYPSALMIAITRN